MQYDLNKDGFLEGMEVAKKAAEVRGRLLANGPMWRASTAGLPGSSTPHARRAVRPQEKMVEEMHMPGYLTRTPHLDELYEVR